MKWLQRLGRLLKAPGPWRRALILALASDSLSLGIGLSGAPQLVVDGLTALALFALLDFRWPLLGGLVVEAIPALAVFPTWTLAVSAMMAAAPVEPRGVGAGPWLEKASSKILDREALAAEAARLRQAGGKLVFTNGVFDLLHVGHLRYLQQARALGDALAVGLNSDASVRRIKGERRPILPQSERAELLAGLACVDYVCIFEEDDPRELIKAVQPSVLVKGGDWPVDKILGADTVLAAGGEVKSLPYVQGRSTTGIIQKIERQAT